MAQHPVAANLLMFVFLVGGVLAFRNIKKEVFPEFELDFVNVSVSYPGASPEEVEQGIILAVEEAARGIDNVSEVTSRAAEGYGSVTLEVVSGGNAGKVYEEIKQEVDRITTFPEEAEEPNISLLSRRREVINLAVYADLEPVVLRGAAETVRDRLLQDPLITQVELSGVPRYEIAIEISQENLRRYGTTLAEVALLVRRCALELPGGGVKTAQGEILVRVKDRRDYGRDFADIPIITTDDGTQVLLGEIATIKDGFEDTDRFSFYDYKPAVGISVYRIGRQTPVEVADAVLRNMEDLREQLPPGIDLKILRDRSDIYRQRAALLMKNGKIGIVLVLLLLGFFLESRLAFWVMMGIPISFLGGLFLMPVMGLSINIISMFAFILALGIVVDDAIVVGENVYEYHQRGLPFLEAAVKGSREVAIPVTFSVLTNIVTFLPLAFVPGFIGKIWKVIPFVVVTVFSISLIECMFILPAHLAHGRRHSSVFFDWFHARQQAFSNWFSSWVRRRYGPFLDIVLRRRYVTVAIAIAIFSIAIGYVKSGRMGMVPMPRVESDFSVVTAVLPYGAPAEGTRMLCEKLMRAAEAVAEEHGGDKLMTGVFLQIGRSHNGVSGGHVGEVRAFLSPPEERPISTAQFTRLWREKAGRPAGLESLVFESDRGGPGSGAALSIRLSHSDSDILSKAGSELAVALADFAIVKDIDDGFTPGKVQFDFHLLPEGRALNLTADDIARQVRYAFYGAEAIRQQRGRNEVRVRVRWPKSERVTEHDIESLLIRTPSGKDVPLSEVASVERGRAYTTIERKDGRRKIVVKANVTPPSEAENVLASLTKDTMPQLQERYPGLTFGHEGRQEDMRESIAALKSGFVFALLGIYVLLAIPFGSYIQPLIVMVSIPFGIVGAIIGHLIMGYSLSILSLMGIIALAGVVVNDSLVLIDFANRRRRTGLDAHTAIMEAGVRRFRPILLTTLTTYGGLAPMIFETSRQARFLIPMALSLGYGILFATLITLALVPSLYMVVEDIRRLVPGRTKLVGSAD